MGQLGNRLAACIHEELNVRHACRGHRRIEGQAVIFHDAQQVIVTVEGNLRIDRRVTRVDIHHAEFIRLLIGNKFKHMLVVGRNRDGQGIVLPDDPVVHDLSKGIQASCKVSHGENRRRFHNLEFHVVLKVHRSRAIGEGQRCSIVGDRRKTDNRIAPGCDGIIICIAQVGVLLTKADAGSADHRLAEREGIDGVFRIHILGHFHQAVLLQHRAAGGQILAVQLEGSDLRQMRYSVRG